MARKFLVDVNLPKHFRFFNADNYIHVVDIDPEMTDSKIWEYALNHQLVILTKDTDFYHRCILSPIGPKIVYFQLGNTTLKELHEYFNTNWETIRSLLDAGNLILAKPNTIEIIL